MEKVKNNVNGLCCTLGLFLELLDKDTLVSLYISYQEETGTTEMKTDFITVSTLRNLKDYCSLYDFFVINVLYFSENDLSGLKIIINDVI